MRSTWIMTAVLLLAATGFAVEKEEGFVPLFNGKDLTGWEGNKDLWTVKDGVLIGQSKNLDHNEFLATTQTFTDFILRFEIRLVDGKGNSGGA